MPKRETTRQWQKTAYAYLTLVVALMSLPGIAQAASVDGYRWRQDDGSESSATWSVAQDTAISDAMSDVTQRLRFSVSQGSVAATMNLLSDFAPPDADTTAAVSDGTYAYIANDSAPLTVLKMALADGTLADPYVSADPTVGTSNYGVIDANGQYAYFVTSNPSIRITKILLADMTYVDSVVLPNDDPVYLYAWSIVVSPENDFIYLDTYDADEHEHVIQMTTGLAFVNGNSFDMTALGDSYLNGMTVGADGSLYLVNGDADFVGVVRKFDPADLSVPTASQALNEGDNPNAPSGVVLNDGNGNFYFTTEPNVERDASVVKVSMSDLSFSAAAVTGVAPGSYLWYAAIDANGTNAYFADEDVPGRIFSVQLADLVTTGSTDSNDMDPGAHFGPVFLGGSQVYGIEKDGDETLGVLGFSVGSTTTSVTFNPRLEYAVKSTTCDVAAPWVQVPASATSQAWEMAPTDKLTDGADSTDAAGVTNGSGTFITGEVKDTGSEASEQTIQSEEYSEYEFSVRATDNIADANYCFRLTDAGDAGVLIMNTYAEASGMAAPSVASHYRWRNDNGSEESAGFAAAQDTGITGLAKSTAKRLRYNLADDSLSSVNIAGAAGLATAVTAVYLDSTATFAYAVGYTDPDIFVYKVRVANNQLVGTASFGGYSSAPGAFVIDVNDAFGYLVLPGAPPTVAKVNLASMTQSGSSFSLTGDEHTPPAVGAVDPSGTYLYLGRAQFGLDAAAVLRIPLASFPSVSMDSVLVGYESMYLRLTAVLVDDLHNKIYLVGDESSDTAVSQLYEINALDFSFSREAFVDELGLMGAALDSTATYIYAVNNSGTVYKVRRSDLTIVDSGVSELTRPTVDYGNNFSIDENEGFAYVDAWNGANLGIERFDLNNLSAGSDFYSTGSVSPVSMTPDPVHHRLIVALDGELTYLNTAPRKLVALEYAAKTSTCAAAVNWAVVPNTATTEAWQMAPTLNIQDGQETTAVVGLTAPREHFVPGHAADTTNETYSIAVAEHTYASAEWSIEATDNAVDGGAYCFRVVTEGTPSFYQSFAEATLLSGGDDAGLTDVSFSPHDPTTDDLITLSATAEDIDNVSSIELFVDGTDDAHRVMTCSYVALPSASETCTFPYGALESGDHTMYARYTDGALNPPTMSAGVPITVVPPVPGAMTQTSHNSVTLGRLHVGSTTTARVEFTLNTAVSGPLTVTFPAGFGIVSGPTSMSDCLSGAAVVGQTVTAVKNACVGEIFLDGIIVTLPTQVGVYLISWINDAPGWTEVIIVTEDQINVDATVDPHITFDVGASAGCNGAFVASDWAIDLGHLNTGRQVASSGASSVDLICTRLSTNATSGAVVTVKNKNGASGLVSSSVPADLIPSSTAGITAGAPNYGLCYSSVGGDNGYDLTVTPAAAPPDATFGAYAPGSCSTSVTSGAESVAALSTTPTEVWRVGDVTSNAFAAMRIKASISGTQPAHNDYADTLTFVATATY